MGQFVRIEVWSNSCLGTATKGNAILDLVDQMDSGQWTPDLWGSVGPVRRPYLPAHRKEILGELTIDRPRGSGEVFNYLFLRKNRPKGCNNDSSHPSSAFAPQPTSTRT